MAAHKRSVAIIGAGAAGLAAAREMLAEGHDVTVFEQGPAVGGVWAYTDSVDSELLGLDAGRQRVHSSMYINLRTNLPREIMGFSDFPFDARAMKLAAAMAAATGHTGASDSSSQHQAKQQQLQLQQGETSAAAAALDAATCTSVDPRQYCGHEEVLRYIRAFALFYGLHSVIRFNTQVVSVAPLTPEQPGQGWRVVTAQATAASSSHAGSTKNATPSSSNHCDPHQHGQSHLISSPAHSNPDGSTQQQHQQHHLFDAVCIANGHYSQPNLPDVKGMASSPVAQMHSHNYRRPEPFAGQVVLVVGASNSGEDVSREVSGVATRVLLSARSWQVAGAGADTRPYGPGANIYRKPMVAELTADGRAVFEDGSSERVDTVIYCTGYRYTFPFFPQGGDALPGIVASTGPLVSPLYLHLLPPAAAPWLSFLGVPWKVVPFPQFELQAKLVARALSGRVALPSASDMQAEVEAEAAAKAADGVPLRYRHMQNMRQFEYNARVSDMCGPDVTAACLSDWRQRMYAAAGQNKRTHTESYRDVWPDQEVLQAARAEIDARVRALEQAVAEKVSQQQQQQQGEKGQVQQQREVVVGQHAR